MNTLLRKIFLLSLLLFPILSAADIAVFVHGYNSSGNTWRNSGIVPLLVRHGWNDPAYSQYPLSQSGKHIVTVELPARAPVEIQASYLSLYLKDISKQFPQQKIHLIAHSAGGVVVRLALVNSYLNFIQTDQTQKNGNKFIPVVQLITIATPHLGSPVAEWAHSASDTPISILAPFVGMDEINQAEILYKQMSRPHKNQFLYWLNQQPHPPIIYTSIIRADDSLISGDWYVPPYSQNMSSIPAISSQSQIILTPGNHGLKFNDGMLLINLLP
ncbi:MAG: hypothetical protein KZQ83_18440 [gamma proteobacterium symbiont of Taylorina sp.]|nr:hypothetical protein [gamma proteobacterium symbiont of Taylorina sp.]